MKRRKEEREETRCTKVTTGDGTRNIIPKSNNEGEEHHLPDTLEHQIEKLMQEKTTDQMEIERLRRENENTEIATREVEQKEHRENEGNVANYLNID